MILLDKTPIAHGRSNPDGTRRETHCCGCWNIYAAEDPEVLSKHEHLLIARCNECDEIRDLTGPLHIAAS